MRQAGVTDPPAPAGPPRVIGRLLALSGSALLMALLLVWTPQSASGFGASTAEATLWQLLNADRTNNGVAPLKLNSTLRDIARWRSKDLVDRNYFSHTILGTSYNVSHWYATNGIAWRYWGENIGYNYGYSDAQSPIQVNTAWMGSSGHRANILNSKFTQAAVGAYGADGVYYQGGTNNIRMYTELFLTPKSGATSTTPRPAAKPAPLGLNTNASAQPSPSHPLDGSQPVRVVVARRLGALSGTLAQAESYEPWQTSLPTTAARAYRVQVVAASARGILQSLLGSLVGFLFG